MPGKLRRPSGGNGSESDAPDVADVRFHRAIFIGAAGERDRSVAESALAYALPYGGAHVRVFYDRILSKAKSVTAPLLGHVFAHEIAHILQGVSRDSATGVMKAKWQDGEYYDMTRERLSFTTQDIDLINTGLQKRATNKVLALIATR